MLKYLHIFKSIIILLIGIVILLLITPVALLALLVQEKSKYAHPPKFATAVLQFCVRLFCWMCGCRLELSGQENLPDTPSVYVGNHQGNFDALLILYTMGEPKVIMAKKEVKVLPFVNLWMHMIRCIFVDRKDHEKAIASMMESQDFLEHGRDILYFAEGTRSQGPDLGIFKGGAFKTAVATGTQIVPFAIDGSYKVFEAQRYLMTAKVKFHILPPIPVSKDDKPRAVSEKVRNAIQEELLRMREEE